jgi:hypothetical protein
MTEQPEQARGSGDRRRDDTREPEREQAEGRDVYVTRDEAGVTSLAENEQAATPRPADPSEENAEPAEGQDGDST